MKFQSYTIDTLSKAGLKILNNQITVFQEKVQATLQDASGNLIPAYLKPQQYKDIKLPTGPTPFPEDWHIVHARREATDAADKKDYYFLTIPGKEKAATSAALPIGIGEYMHRRSVKGLYHVVYLNRDVIVISTKQWAKDYEKGLREAPTETIFWSEFKCKQGSPEAKV